jgi:hypothetical protein
MHVPPTCFGHPYGHLIKDKYIEILQTFLNQSTDIKYIFKHNTWYYV